MYSNSDGAQKTSDTPTRSLKNYDDMSIRLDTVPALDGRTGGPTMTCKSKGKVCHTPTGV